MDNKTTIDEDLLSRLRYTRSRLEDSEISTDAVYQIDDGPEATAISLNKKLQVSIGSATGSGPNSDQYNPSEKPPRPVIPPKPKQRFKVLFRQQIQCIKKDSKVTVINGNDEMIPTVPTTNHNFTTINKACLRLTKSSPPQILTQPMKGVSPPLPPLIMPLNNRNGEPKLAMIETDTLAQPIGQTQPELFLYPNGCPPPQFSSKEPGTPPVITGK